MSYSYANGGGGEKGCAAFWKVPGLNTPYNAITVALMTAFWHARSKPTLLLGVQSVIMLLGNEIRLKTDSRLLSAAWMACVTTWWKVLLIVVLVGTWPWSGHSKSVHNGSLVEVNINSFPCGTDGGRVCGISQVGFQPAAPFPGLFPTSAGPWVSDRSQRFQAEATA